MEKRNIVGLLFIVLSILLVSLGSAKLLKDNIFNGEIEITKDEIKEVNKYLKDKYGIKGSNTLIFEEYYKRQDGNIVSKIPDEKKYITNRIYLVKYKDLEFYVKKEIDKKEKYYDNYVNVYLNNRLANYISKKYKNYNIKSVEIKDYDNSKYLLQNNSNLYKKDLLKITDKEYIKLLQNNEQEIILNVKDKLNNKNIKDEVKKIINTVNKEKELKVRAFIVQYQNGICIEYYRDTISIYSEEKEIYDKYIVLDKKNINEDSIYIDNFLKLSKDSFNF